MEMIEQKQWYEFVRSVFERYHDLQTSVSDRMAQSSMYIGPEASILIKRYITEVEWKPASNNQATKIYYNCNRMQIYKLSAAQRLSNEGDDSTGITTPTENHYHNGSARIKHRVKQRLAGNRNPAGGPSSRPDYEIRYKRPTTGLLATSQPLNLPTSYRLSRQPWLPTHWLPT